MISNGPPVTIISLMTGLGKQKVVRGNVDRVWGKSKTLSRALKLISTVLIFLFYFLKFKIQSGS